MPELSDGESAEVRGSSGSVYRLKNVGGVYSCSCPSWRNQSLSIDLRSCKHIRQYRGEQAEQERLGMNAQSAPTSAEPRRSPPALLLAQSWDNEQDLSGWWWSEKMDGVRAYWDGKQFLSRQGNCFYAPEWFTAGFPHQPLDGELWIGRGQFQQTVSVVRRKHGGEAWQPVRYVIFDAPTVSGGFEARQAFAKQLQTQSPSPYVRVLEQSLCRGNDHLREELSRVEALGGEGLMLRQPESQYESGRSETLLKIKTFHDAEARVLSHLPGTGRHKGRLGALLVSLPDGTQFSVGSGFSDRQRESPPPIGSFITFRYQELTTNGVPRFPTFVRVRSDQS